jgi:glycosyltransferase involved in cell wall biosynthesis
VSVFYHYIRHYRLHLLRRKLQLRALRKSGELKPALDRTDRIKPRDVLLFTTVRNERVRLPYFLQHYRNIGVKHFFVVDNGSDDESFEFLSAQPDVSVWTTTASYGGARAGMDWINALARRHAPGHWIIFADADEFLIYPFCDSRPLRALTDWLDEAGIRAMSAMMLDMYPKGKIAAQTYESGQNPFEIAAWFDGGNYTIHKNEKFGNLWIQGGPRQRVFFADDPENAPALNKIPLVKWQKDYVFVSSAHMLLPSRLNKTFDAKGGEQICGVMLHAKFVDPVIGKAQEELERGEHYGDGREYARYAAGLAEEPDLWTPRSEKYLNWRQLEGLGLISRGNWA